MRYLVNYEENELEAAARYIYIHNPAAKTLWDANSPERVSERIKSNFMEIAERNARLLQEGRRDEWCGWSSTGGWICVYSSSEPNTIDVRIFVSPLIDRPWGSSCYGTEEINLAPKEDVVVDLFQKDDPDDI